VSFQIILVSLSLDHRYQKVKFKGSPKLRELKIKYMQFLFKEIHSCLLSSLQL